MQIAQYICIVVIIAARHADQAESFRLFVQHFIISALTPQFSSGFEAEKPRSA